MRDDTAMQVSGGSFPPCVAPPVLLGWIGTLVVVGVQLAIAGWMVWAMIRAPD